MLPCIKSCSSSFFKFWDELLMNLFAIDDSDWRVKLISLPLIEHNNLRSQIAKFGQIWLHFAWPTLKVIYFCDQIYVNRSRWTKVAENVFYIPRILNGFLVCVISSFLCQWNKWQKWLTLFLFTGLLALKLKDCTHMLPVT